MSVAKMEYLNVHGPEKSLLAALGCIAECECFAPESSEAIHSAIRFDTNRYEPLLTKAKGLLQDLGEEMDEEASAQPFTGGVDAFELDTVSDYLEKFAGQVAGINKRRVELTNELELYVKTEGLLRHMEDVDINFDELFRVGYLKLRIGRLPKNSFVRLAYYNQKGFNFTHYFNFIVYDFDGENYWGVYFAPADNAKEIDDIFKSLYFERIRVPDFVHGKPMQALESVRKTISDLQTNLDDLVHPSDIAAERDMEIIRNMAHWLEHMDQLYEMEKYALVFNNTFYISGFVPQDKYNHFVKQLSAVPGVKVQESEHSQELPVKPPVKLKNNWFARPYEMFTTMYGLPTYNDIDPTFIVSIIYSVLYGLMFADLGQGIVLGLFGYFYMYRKRKMPIGAILARAGFFSAVFGLLFGSVFGNEHLLDPMWHALGLEEKPFEVMGAQSVNTILLVSISIGVAVLILAMIVSIVSKLMRKQLGAALTGSNGLAGLIFYVAAVFLLVDMVMLNTGIAFSPLYIICLLVVPFIVMYLQEPLSEILDGHGLHVESWGDLLISSFFEMFVTILDFLANTVSFLRVGGFVLAHAGMMSVVETLASMSSGAGSILVMVLGNVFVICLEGLIVGIQALRLNYYELFSRFFEADGVPFKALSVRRQAES
ncbi:MAG: V-type ATP synthase subunit I [Oscillospiraceae bacterium]